MFNRLLWQIVNLKYLKKKVDLIRLIKQQIKIQ